ncbi:acylphosphatase [Rhabdochromatium marinum]|uniref:acylphosphatase n=1 Tax=Rhabdochromatium marinum TaxID=48729 RepID=UPI001907C6CE|nr:acylphosphatase [Rhabdochromatium marinum]MBK1650420.1 acylphosphatase [Rhabdochromatium marinum]
MAQRDERGEAQVCYRCLISGRVQGVFFRASTREQAERFGVTGHARNCPDGRVEVLACGAPEAVESLRAWLAQGPPQARVDDLSCEPLEWRAVTGFTTG